MQLKVIQETTGISTKLNIDIPEDIITIIDYSEKSILVVGGTALIKSDLKSIGGIFGRNFNGKVGWIFRKSDENKVRRIVNAANKFIRLKEITITSDCDREFVEPLIITQISAGTYNLDGDTTMLEDELKSLGCELVETKGRISIWHFTKNKLKAVEALVSAVNKLR